MCKVIWMYKVMPVCKVRCVCSGGSLFQEHASDLFTKLPPLSQGNSEKFPCTQTLEYPAI